MNAMMMRMGARNVLEGIILMTNQAYVNCARETHVVQATLTTVQVHQVVLNAREI